MNLHPQFPKRVFLECTRTLHSPLHTGIERVVRNIIASSSEVAASMGLVCVPVAFRPRHGFVSVEGESWRHEYHSNLDGPSSRLKRRLEQWGLLDLARMGRRHFERYSSNFSCGLQRFSNSKLQFGPDDVLLLLDSSWTAPYWKNVREAQKTGAVVGAALYDLLPIQLPDSMTINQRECFAEWWNRAYHAVDFITTISKSVYIDALSYHERLGTRIAPLIGGEFPLGADFLPGTGKAKIRPMLLHLAQDNLTDGKAPIYLCVGTLSPRKQQSLVLDAFDNLWNRGGQATLVFVGGSGWHSDSFIGRLRSHPRIDKTLFWFSDLSDRELQWCYQRADGLIAASMGEGFDLPIVEALRQECSVLASDIPVHREVAGTFAAYFPVGRADRLAELVGKQLQYGTLEHTTAPKYFTWPDWNQSCQELLRLITRLSRDCKENQSAMRNRAA